MDEIYLNDWIFNWTFFSLFELFMMVEGGGHETLHAAKMAQNGKNSFLSQKSQYFLLHLA